MVAELVQLLFVVKIQLLEPLEMADYFTLFQSWAFVFIYYYFISCKVNYTP